MEEHGEEGHRAHEEERVLAAVEADDPRLRAEEDEAEEEVPHDPRRDELVHQRPDRDAAKDHRHREEEVGPRDERELSEREDRERHPAGIRVDHGPRRLHPEAAHGLLPVRGVVGVDPEGQRVRPCPDRREVVPEEVRLPDARESEGAEERESRGDAGDVRQARHERRACPRKRAILMGGVHATQYRSTNIAVNTTLAAAPSATYESATGRGAAIASAMKAGKTAR